MEDTPNTSKQSLSEHTSGSTKKSYLRWKAVIAGVIVDLGGTTLLAIGVGVFLTLRVLSELPGRLLSGFEIQELIAAELEEGLSGSILVIVLGILLSIFGGYVAGRIAKYDELKHALATGIGVLLVSAAAGLLIGGDQFLTGRDFNDWTLTLFRSAINIGATILGGYLAYFQRTRRSEVEAARS